MVFYANIYLYNFMHNILLEGYYCINLHTPYIVRGDLQCRISGRRLSKLRQFHDHSQPSEIVTFSINDRREDVQTFSIDAEYPAFLPRTIFLTG